MTILVTYFSQTGNTKKVAEAIAAEIEGEKELLPMKQVESLEGYDLSFVGFPIQQFGAPPVATKFLGEKAAGKKVALFVTHASPSNHPLIGNLLDKCKEAASSSDLRYMRLRIRSRANPLL